MLRLTEIDDPREGVTLRVEGQIVASSVSVLDHECRAAVARAGRIRLDLAGVRYVDTRGAELLSHLRAACAIVNCSPLIEERIQELLADGATP